VRKITRKCEVLFPSLGKKKDSFIVIQALRKTDYREPNLISTNNFYFV
jgi:hypothetical protein